MVFDSSGHFFGRLVPVCNVNMPEKIPESFSFFFLSEIHVSYRYQKFMKFYGTKIISEIKQILK